MSAPRRRNRVRGHRAHGELNLLPLMNILIVLIPMLLLSAVFIEMRAIEMSAPSSSAAQLQAAESLDLVIRIGGDAYVIEGNGIPSMTVARPHGTGVDAAPGDAASAQLAQAFHQIVAAHPENKEIRIVAESTTRYEELVTLMDLARAAGLPLPSLEGNGSEA